MFRLVLLQVLATALVSVLAAFVAGPAAALSAALGGMACFVPNGLFALRLALSSRRPGGPGAATFFVSELVKVGATVALLALVAWAYKDLVWLALIAAVVVSLKSYLIALVWR
jgi:ATP synthase protein I